MPMNKEEIGARIREVRLRLKMTQREFGALLGVVPSAVSAYEKGEKLPQPEGLGRIVELGHVSYDWLLSGRETAAQPGGGQPLERLAAKMIEYLETQGGHQFLSEILPHYNSTQSEQGLSENERRLLEAFRSLPPERQEKLVEDIELINRGLKNRD